MTSIVQKNQLQTTEGKVKFILNLLKCLTCSPIFYVFTSTVVAVISTMFLHDGKSRIIALMWAMSCLILGTLVGFLFGIPKRLPSRESDKEVMPGASESQQRVTPNLMPNTNLQEVSDWLTKIIIGVSLVEFNKIVSSLNELATQINKTINGASGDQDISMFIMPLIMFFSISGFLAGYLGTMTVISRQIYDADKYIHGFSNKFRDINTHIKSIEERVRRHEDTSDLISAAKEYTHRAWCYRELPHQKLNDKEASLLNEKADHFLNKAIIILEYVLKEKNEEKNITARIVLATCYSSLSKPDYGKAIDILTEGIQVAEESHEHKHGPALARLYYNKACCIYSMDKKFAIAKPYLIKAIKIQAFYRHFAQMDEDWSEVKDSSEFKTVV